MSQELFDPEIVAEFIVEAKEHLETIEPNLLELEKAPDNISLLNDIFRPMHSLKGASGFLNFNRINKLAHRCENILDELRKGEMLVTSEIMDVILASTDALNQIINNLELEGNEGDTETEHLIEQIDALMNGESPAAAEEESLPEAAAEEPAYTEETPPESAGETETETAAAELSPNEEQSAAESTAAVQPSLSPKEWIASRPVGESYALVTFGEGHLRDFVEEAREIIENLNQGLLALEDTPDGEDELVHDIFRFFHNLKGNSGIISYNELNKLTHEAETLLNSVRKGEMKPSHELVDLLLLVVDCMEALINAINMDTEQVAAPDVSEVLAQLQQVNAGGAIELPKSLRADAAQAAESKEDPAQGAAADVEFEAPVLTPINPRESDDAELFKATVTQQMDIIHSALNNIEKDGNHQDSIDALYRCLIAIRNACGFLELEELRVYADRTAGIVDQGRKAHLDFSIMLDLLRQETSIIEDMLAHVDVNAAVEKAAQKEESAAQEKAAPAPKAAEEKPAKPEQKAPAAAVQPAPKEPAKQTEPAPAPKAQTPAPKPAAPAAAKAAPAKAPAAKPSAAPAAKKAGPAGKPANGKATAKGGTEGVKTSSTIRVDHEKLDHLMNLIGELIINRNRYSLIARNLEESGPSADLSHIAQSLSETTYAMARISDELQDTIMKVRMVPVSTVFTRFPRLVRDLSHKMNKEIELVLEGEETELDKSVVEVIGDPMVHLIRNSVDHGIESEEDRIAAGKPAKGTITLRAFHKGNSVAIEIEDDGKGIDPAKMREVAVHKGIITAEEASQLDDQAAIELIFAPGFSSAEQITDISGRGVGMDVVRTNIKSLKGSISTVSELGKGTRFTLSLPLTLAIIDALMVNVSGETYAIPLDAVSETTKLESAYLTDINGRHAITLRGEVLGIVELAELLGLPHKEQLPEVLSVVVIHANGRRLGLVVDNLVERQEIVIKPLGAYLGDLRGLSGATIMGDGSVILILDPHEIYKMSTSMNSLA